MGNTFKLGNYVNGIFQDASNNIGIGAAPSGTYKLEVTGTAKVSGVSTLTGNVFLSNGSGNAVATLGGSPTANDGASLSMIPSNSAINWAIRVNWNLAGALEFCPSTAGGGSTFSSTPSFYLSSTGLATFSSFGSHSFSSAGTGYNKLTIRNTTAGTGNGAQLSIGTNADADQLYIQSFATTFTTSGMNIAGGAVINGEGPGGLSIAATQSSIGFYTNGAGSANERMNIASDGVIRLKFASDRGIRMNGATSSFANIAAYQVFTENIRELRLTGSTVQFYSGDGSNSTGTQRMSIAEGGNISYTNSLVPTAAVNSGFYTIDSAANTISLGANGAVNIGGFSGMVLVTNTANGVTMLFVCGGGGATLVSQSIGGAAGSMTNWLGSGYTFTTAYTSTANYSFQIFRTRVIA